jgi:dTDP-4-amino-4,6-dideoxygalactose transaminase
MNRNTKKVPFASPSIGREEEEAVLKVLRSGWLTTGKEALSFEKEFAAYTGAERTLAVNSATAGLHLVMEAMGIGPGDIVLVPTYTFTATAEVVRYCGADPWFVDIGARGWNMDPQKAADALAYLKRKGKRARGIIPVHIGGDPQYLNDLHNLARENGIFLVEDAAHCFPVRTKKGFVGTYTDAGVFSFYANKTITTGEGGMIAVSDPKLAKRMEIMRLHGINKAAWDRYTEAKASWEYDVVAPGYKYNMTDLAAAIGRVQLRRAEDMMIKRRRLAEEYLTVLEDLDFLELPERKEEHAWHLFLIKILPEKLHIRRNRFIEELQEEGIGTSVHYKPLHMMSYYQNRYGLAPGDFPVSRDAFQRVISLPLFPDMTSSQLRRVTDAIKKIGSTHRIREAAVRG